MRIRTFLLATVLTVFCVVAGCNCPCKNNTACAMPESGMTVQAASETAVR